jgi:hypothetical protein
MENLIGKKYVKVDPCSSNLSFQEFTIFEVESIAGKQIVYTTDGKSFCLDDLEVSDLDDLKQFVLNMVDDKSLQEAFNKKFNKNFDINFFLRENCKSVKSKSFKIFGWTITLSKSK